MSDVLDRQVPTDQPTSPSVKRERTDYRGMNKELSLFEQQPQEIIEAIAHFLIPPFIAPSEYHCARNTYRDGLNLVSDSPHPLAVF